MPGLSSKQAISVASYASEEAKNVLRAAKNLAYMKGIQWGFNHAVAALNEAGILHTTHSGDHDVPSRHSRVH